MRAPPTLLAALALTPIGVYAADYMNAEQAARILFPQAVRFDKADATLTPAQTKALEDAGVKPRNGAWPIRVAKAQDASTLGWVILDEVIGKFELISYAVGVNADGTVRQVEILSYRESHGGEVRLPAWRKQFVGKKAADPIEVGNDIANISGATLSCRHVTEGVKRVAKLVQVLRGDGALK